MQVLVSARHMSVSDDVKEYCQGKAERLIRYYDRLQSIEVILDGQPGVHTAQIIVHADRTDPFIAEGQQGDLLSAIDVVVDKIKQQLRRHKEKLRNRKHMGSPQSDETP